jgi:hypothetical protein
LPNRTPQTPQKHHFEQKMMLSYIILICLDWRKLNNAPAKK